MSKHSPSRAKSRRRALARLRAGQRGQSLIEVALVAPLLIMLICYTLDFAYFFLVCAALSGSAGNAALYSIQGFNSVAGGALPKAGPITGTTSVAALALGDVSMFTNASVDTAVYVCTNALITATNPARCASYNSAPVPSSIDADPENTLFTLNRVDVYYTIHPPIPLGGIIPAGFVPTQFHRMIEMRALN